MTEQEWLGSNEPKPMLEYLRGKASDRKLRLFACACCRHVCQLLTDDRNVNAVEVGEQFADGLALETERATAENDGFSHCIDDHVGESDWIYYGYEDGKPSAAYFASDASVNVLRSNAADSAQSTVYRVLQVFETDPLGCQEDVPPPVLLRDIFGNPFRPITINSKWLTPTVTKLAKAAYDNRAMPSGELDPARLAVLADALEDAGCDNHDILGHLRIPDLHVRGCFALDLLLGQE